jgi:hypothetical protein
MTENCYWPGGGKEGQFPPNFGQRTRVNAAGAATSPHGITITSFSLCRSKILLDYVMLKEELICDTGDLACISKSFQSFKGGKIPTFMDSRASDTMYVSKDIFAEYKVTPPHMGNSAKATGRGFEIVGEGKVIRQYMVEGKPKDIT